MSSVRHDVAIIGAGIAGLAASVWLRKAGMRVVCLDPRRYPQRKVGESLDWSSPGLLRRLGIDPDALIEDGIATYKRKIVVCEASDAIVTARGSDRLSDSRRRAYTRHVFRLGHSFNAHIENVIYRHPIRWGIGLQSATYIYTFFAFFMNALHARFEPRGPIGMSVFGVLFLAARSWIAGWTLVARAVLWSRGALYGER